MLPVVPLELPPVRIAREPPATPDEVEGPAAMRMEPVVPASDVPVVREMGPALPPVPEPVVSVIKPVRVHTTQCITQGLLIE